MWTTHGHSAIPNYSHIIEWQADRLVAISVNITHKNLLVKAFKTEHYSRGFLTF